MSNVEINVQTEYWTWDSCPLTWDDAEATWDEAYDRLYDMANAETLKLAETPKKAQRRKVNDKLDVSSEFSKNTSFYRRTAETLKTTESKRMAMVAKPSDAFSVKDKDSCGYGFHSKRSLRIVESNRAFNLDRSFAEIFGLSETYWDNIAFFISSAETFTISENCSRKNVFDRTMNDYLRLAEGLARAMEFKLNDGFALKDFIKRSVGYKWGVAEKFSVVEKSANKVNHFFSDGVGTGEGFEQPKLAKGFYEKVDLEELFKTSVKQISYEDVGLESGFGKSVSYNRFGSEAFSASDGLAKSITAHQDNGIAISEASSNNVQTVYGDGFGLLDEQNKSITANVLRDIVIVELLKKNFKRGLGEEVFNILDAFYKNGVHFRLSFSDDFALEDNYRKNFKLVPTDYLRIKDDFGRVVKYYLLLKDLFYVSETYWDNIAFYFGVLEQCNIHEADWRKVNQSTKQAITVKELLSKDFVRGTELEEFGLLDAVRVSKLYNRGFGESFGVQDAKLGSKIEQGHLENIELKDVLTKLRNLKVSELITCDDEIGRQVIFATVIKEALSVIEHRYKSQNVVIKDELSVSDNIRKRIEQLTPEAFILIDELIREFIARRIIGESVTVEDYLAKGVGLLMSEEMNTYDTLIKACDGILSNISIKEGELTLDEFLEIVNKPPNYTKFIEFKVGEYEYQEALVRIVIATKVRQTQPIASAVTMHVDIPDTDDKGEVEITDTTAPTKVYFNKFYYNPPSVNVTLKGGNTADGVLIPNVLSTDYQDDNGRYFEVELWDENWSERKTGKIYWVSKGY